MPQETAESKGVPTPALVLPDDVRIAVELAFGASVLAARVAAEQARESRARADVADSLEEAWDAIGKAADILWHAAGQHAFDRAWDEWRAARSGSTTHDTRSVRRR